MDKTLTGKIKGNPKIEGSTYRTATAFLMEPEKGENKTWKIRGTHIDRLVPNTNIEIKPSAVVKGWIDGYTTFDDKGDVEYSFPD